MHEVLIRIESCMVVQNKHDVSTNTKQLYFEHAIMQTMHGIVSAFFTGLATCTSDMYGSSLRVLSSLNQIHSI